MLVIALELFIVALSLLYRTSKFYTYESYPD